MTPLLFLVAHTHHVCSFRDILCIYKNMDMLLFCTNVLKCIFAHSVACYPDLSASSFFHIYLGDHSVPKHRKQPGFFSGHIVFHCLNVP